MTVLARTVGRAEPHPEQARLRQRVITLLKVGLSVLAIGLVLYTVDLASAWQRTAGQNLWFLATAVGALFLQICVGGLRWHVILRRLQAPVRIRSSLQLFYIAAFFNIYLWGAMAGDVVRGWLSSRSNVPARTALNSIVLDRVAALAGVALLVLIAVPYWVARFGNTPIIWLAAGLATLGLLGILMVAQFERLPPAWQHLRLLRLVQSLGEATRTIFLRPAAAVPTLLLAIAAQMFMALSAYLVAQSLAIDLSLLDCLMLMQPVALLTSLPISIGGWGVRETAMIGLLGLVGVPASAALVLSVELGLITMAASLPGLVFWFLINPKNVAAATASPDSH
jgi:uncharacterized protein (TIRG00374 family)